MAATTSAPETGAFELTRPPRSLWGDALRRLMRNKMAVASVFVILFMVAVALLSPFIRPWDPVEYMSRPADVGGGGTRLPPAWMDGGNSKFWLGTDASGRDVLSRVMVGAQVSLAVGIIPVAIIVTVGLLVGMTAGYMGGRVDNLLMRLTDVVYAFPDLLFIIIIMTALRSTPIYNIMDGLLLIFLSLSIIGWVGMARLVRGQILSLKEKEFIEAARMTGASDRRIIKSHLLPHLVAPIIVLSTLVFAQNILFEAGLSFLGVGIQVPTASWGNLLATAPQFYTTQPWLMLWPGLAVLLTTLAFNLLGDGLRDAFDPRSSQ